MKKICIRLVYFCGDDPALHKVAVLYESNAIRPCIRCHYSRVRDGPYNPRRHYYLRNADQIYLFCDVAERAVGKKARGDQLTAEDRNAFNHLKDFSVCPIVNCTSYAPMGYIGDGLRNDVYNTPCDILHTFECGLAKNITLYVLSIVINIRKLDRHYNLNEGLLDTRICSMRHFPKLKNLHMTYFAKGLSFIASNKTKSDLLKTGGGAGGLRSCEFISICVQLYMAVSTT